MMNVETKCRKMESSRDGAHSDVSSASFASDSNRILAAIDDTEKGVGKEWKNVQPAVVHSNRKLHQAVQHMMTRMELMETKMDQLIVAVSTLTHDRQVKEERYASDNRAFSRAWAQLQDSVDHLRSDFDRSSGAHTEAVRVLREITIPELERELDAVKEVHRVQSRKEHRIEQLEKDGEELRRHKVDLDEFQREVRTLKVQMEQMSLFPAIRSPLSGGSVIAASDGASVAPFSSWSDGVVSLSRWLWHGGSFAEATCSKSIPWHERLVRVGEAMRWSKTHPNIIKIDREGIYKLTFALFHDGKDVSVPQMQVFVNNDAVLNALSSSNTCILRSRSANSENRATRNGACGRCRVVRCCCEPEALNGMSVSDILLLPFGSVVTIAYRGDARNVKEAMLELQCLT